MSKRPVVFLASGTRGDVQPYVILARELLQRGQPATVATHAPFRPLVQQAGVPFALLDANPSDLLAQPRLSAALRISRNPLRSLLATLHYLREGQAWYARLLHSAWAACQPASLVIGGVPTLWSASIAEALHVPHLFAFLQPVTRTVAFPSTLLPITRSLGTQGNSLSHHFFEQSTWRPWRNTINQWRRETLGLPALQASPLRHLHNQPVLYGYSAHISPKPSDWPANHHLTGYWFDEAAPHLTAETEQFLAQGNNVVYIGFGTGSVQRPQTMLGLIGSALAQANLRAIVLWPQPVQALDGWRERMLFVQDAPHATLFPRVRAVVHHGGAGTTAQAIRAGVPSLVLPAMADQYFWGGRVAALGIGPAPIPQHALTVQLLADGLHTATQNEAMRQRAQALGAPVRTEDGVGRAIEVIENLSSHPLKSPS